MQCPTCASEDTIRAEMVYDAGTSRINTTTTGAGVGFGRGGIGVGVGSAGTTGVHQSRLAAKVAPPAKPTGQPWASLLVVGILAIIISRIVDPWASLIGVGIALTVVGVAGIVFTVIRLQKDWPKAYEQWTHLWICNRCGAAFYV